MPLLGALSLAAAVALAAALVVVLRGGSRRPLAVAAPAAAVLFWALLAVGSFPASAYLLGGVLTVAPAVLAGVAGRVRDWNALALYAVGAIIGVYGVIGRALCLQDGACHSQRSLTAALVGGAIATGAFAFLYVEAVRAR